MANDLSSFAQVMVKLGALYLRANAIVPRMISQDFDAQQAEKKGAIINVTIQRPATTNAVVAGVVPTSENSVGADTFPISLDDWRESKFAFTDKEYMEVNDKQVLPVVAQTHLAALCDYVDSQIIAKLWKKAVNSVGTAGSTPNSSDLIVDAFTELNKAKVPQMDRGCVINSSYEGVLLKQNIFHNAQLTGNLAGLLNGGLGRKFGFDMAADQNMNGITLTVGTRNGAELINSTTHAVGDKSVAIDTGAGTAKIGERFTVAGDSQVYVVTADIASTAAGTLSYFPPAKVAWANNAQITWLDSNCTIYGLGIQRLGAGFASRPLADDITVAQELGSIIASVTDDVSGLTLRYEISRVYKKTWHSFDVLFGADVVRPEHIVRIIG